MQKKIMKMIITTTLIMQIMKKKKMEGLNVSYSFF